MSSPATAQRTHSASKVAPARASTQARPKPRAEAVARAGDSRLGNQANQAVLRDGFPQQDGMSQVDRANGGGKPVGDSRRDFFERRPPAEATNSTMVSGGRGSPQMGNQAAQRLLVNGAIQAKLTINQPDDPFEQEADRVADAVVAMSVPAGNGEAVIGASPVSVRRQCSCAGSCEKCQGKTGIQRRASDTGGASESASASDTAPPSVDHARSSGRQMSRESRAYFEPRFGRSFENVRIHTDNAAAESARDIHALAYTAGSDIVFGDGHYQPGTHEGRRLLAHELTHVVQQDSNRVARSVQRVCGPTDIAAAVAGRTSCNDRFGSPFLPGVPLFKFNKSCDDFATGEDTTLQTFVAGQPATATFEIHGFASSDGSTAFNQDLGCARAMKAFSVMTTADPAHAFAGIAAPRITAVVNHGPVSSSAPAANLRSAVIRVLGGSPGPTPTPTPTGLQTVTIPPDIRGAATPAAMTPNRIPPRVDTPVSVTFGGTPTAAAPVSVAVEGGGGGNGSATVNGAASAPFSVTGATVVNLRGVDQTLDPAHAGNLRLVARQRGTQLGASGGFSVSSIPVSMSHPFSRLITDADCPTFGLAAACGFRGMIVDQNLASDSTVAGDLDRVDESERIQTTTATGIFAGTSLTTGCYVPCVPSPPDFHGSPGLAGQTSPGVATFNQTFMFRDNRTGASEIPMADSGFVINFDVAPIPGSGVFGFFQSFQLTVSSIGTAHGATDPNPTCPSGTITSTAGPTSVTRVIPL